MNILFVCTAGQQRSPTGAELYETKGYNTDFAGIHGMSNRALTEEKLEWADTIVAMEEMHRQYIVQNYSEQVENNDINVLHIPDVYYQNDPELQHRIQNGMEEVL
mgnify:CR=1 FL=1